MWIFNLFTEYIVHVIFFTGVLGLVVGTLLEFIPVIDKYRLPIQIVGGLLLILGVYLEGSLSKDKEWELRVANAKVEAAKKEVAAADKTAEIQTQVIEKIKVVREKGQTLIKYIDRDVVKNQEVIKYVENCPVPKEIIDLHNAAAEINKAAEGDKK
mgnify:CR=1 FL=1